MNEYKRAIREVVTDVLPNAGVLLPILDRFDGYEFTVMQYKQVAMALMDAFRAGTEAKQGGASC